MKHTKKVVVTIMLQNQQINRNVKKLLKK
jgi:hypothetical protein